MGFISNFANIFKKGTQNKIYQALYGLGMKFTKYDDSGRVYLDKGYNSNSDVFSVISQKSNEFARIPYFIKRVKDQGNKQRYDQLRMMTKGVVSPETAITKAVFELKAFEDSELPMPLERPNKDQSWAEFFALFETMMDITGNFYVYLRSPSEGMNAGKPIDMYVLPSHLIQIVLKSNIDFMSDDSPIDYYMLVEGNSYIKFKRDEVVHVKYPNPNFDLQGSHLYGQSRLRAALTNIQSSNSAALLNAKTLANGGSFGFISTKEPMTSDQAKDLKSRLVEMDNSPKRLSNIVGSSHEVVFTRISLTTEELRPFDYLEFDQKAICNVLQWDDKLLNNDDGSKYDNYKIAVRRSITNGIVPNLRLLEEAFNNEILPRFKEYNRAIFMFDESQLPEMQDDMMNLTKRLNDALDRGVINRDEYRFAFKYPKLGTPEMETHTVAMNVISLAESIMPSDNFDE